MDSLENTKLLARSKHFHSLHKDKNKYKKKAKHVQQAKQKQGQQGQPTSNQPKEVESDSDVESGEEGEQTTASAAQGAEVQAAPTRRRGKFSRRVVEDNSYRYAEPEQEDSEEEGPINLRKLIEASASCGSLSSQFRFQGEKEWDDEHLLTAKSSVNCDALGRSLQTLSLPHLLQVSDTQLFTPDLLEPRVKSQPKQSQQQQQQQQSPSAQQRTSTTQPKQNPTAPTSATTTAAIPTAPTPSKPVDKTEKKDEDLLDQLLQLDTNTVPATTSSSTSNNTQQAKEEDLESWLDSVI